MGNKFPNLTLKRVLRRYKEIEKKHPKDRSIHEIIEKGIVGKKEFMGFIQKAVKD